MTAYAGTEIETLLRTQRLETLLIALYDISIFRSSFTEALTLSGECVIYFPVYYNFEL